jgi:Tol biopolymer transport system component
MINRYRVLLLLVAAVTFSLLLRNLWSASNQQPIGASSTAHSNSKPTTMKPAANSYGKLPMSFEKNQGQTDRKVKFLSRGSGYSLFLTSDEAVLALRPPARDDGRQPLERRHWNDAESQPQPDVIRMKLIGANASARLEGIDRLPSTANYFTGKNPTNWRTDVPLYSGVRYRNVYPGIDLLYHGDGGQLEYDFTVAPGVSPDSIRLDYDGTGETQIDLDGNLVIHTRWGEVLEKSPLIYQVLDEGRKEVAGHFVLRGHNQIGFEISNYDKSKTLVIDPALVYSSYLGGSADDIGYGIATDGQGNVYVTGRTLSTNFPTLNPFHSTNSGGKDIFVTKLNPTGTGIIYSTYIGGSGDDGGYAVALNSSAEAYITGFTSSPNFPTVAALQPLYGGGTFDAFFVRLNATGSSLIYSSYAGGSGEDFGTGIALDSSRNIYGIGTTSSTNLTTVNPIQPFNAGGYDAYVIELTPSGSAIKFATYAGGSGTDSGNAIAVDSSGSIYAIGDTSSTNLTTVNALQSFNAGGVDAFLAKLTPSGTSIVFSTYAGGNGDDSGDGIALDGLGDICVVGYTNSANLALIVNAVQQIKGAGYDAFVAKLSPNGNTILYSTFLGGNGDDFGYAIATDSAGNAYVTGVTASSDFPLVNPVHAYSGARDVFVTKLWPSGSTILFSTYLGGSSDDYGYGIASDESGNAYLTGPTFSTNFSTVNPFQAGKGGAFDLFVAKIATGSQSAGPKIAFASSRNGGNHDIYLMDPDGSNQIRITSNAAYDDEPKWSPDGRKIAFMSKRDGNFEIYSMNADGTGQTRLTNNPAADGFPAWSPDGTKIAFVSGDLHNPITFEIYVMNADGSNRTRLTTDSLIDGVPSWSPDGTKIVFMSGAGSLFDLNSFDIFVMNANGSNRTRLTNNTIMDGQPSYSPDGTKILFSSGDAFATAGIEIYVMNADGSNKIQLTNNSLPDGFPAWSPDGAKIVFASGISGSNPFRPFDETNVELYVMNADGSNRTQLTNNSVLDWFPDWQPVALPGTSVQFSAANYNIGEGGVAVTVTVNRTGDTSGASSVDFLTSDGSATQAQDYVVASGTLSFAASETSKTFSVLIVDDAFVEANQTLNLTLADATGASLGSPSTAIITIIDNDTAGSISPAPKRFAAALDGAQETPANNSLAKGSGLVLLNANETSAQVGLQFQNLGSAETAAHIHGNGAPGVMAPILFALAPPIVNPLSVQISPTAQQVADLKGGLHYQNVHSINFPNGEIRGQLRWNPTLEENFFVRQQYLDFLSRDGDPGGFSFWVNQVSSCQADAQCFHDRTITTSNAFFFEPEFQQTAGFVFRAYRVAFGNTQPFPNPDGSNTTEANKLIDYSTFVADRARVVGGADLAAAQQAFAELFASRPAFTTKYAAATTGPQFVDAMLATIQSADNVDLSAQRQALIDQYNNAGAGIAGQGMVLYRLADDNSLNPINNQAFINAEYNRQFALTLYFGYLRRNPDIGGFLFWQSQINLAPVRDVPKQNALVCSFISAAEYQLRFGANAPRTNTECPQ